MFGDSDLGVFFDAGTFGVPVQFAGSSATGIFDQPQLIQGGFDALLPSVTLPYNAFAPMPKVLDLINVNGQNYTVNDRTAMEDGAIYHYSLKIAP